MILLDDQGDGQEEGAKLSESPAQVDQNDDDDDDGSEGDADVAEEHTLEEIASHRPSGQMQTN